MAITAKPEGHVDLAEHGIRTSGRVFRNPTTALLYTHALMRGPSEWTVGERELFAAFVSRVNQCPF